MYFGGIRLDNNNRVRFSLENEIRQHIVRENNFTRKANQTDYFIIDIEYETKGGKKFDIVAVEWEANSTSRKLQRKYNPKLVIFELKYAESSMKGESGLCKHLEDFEAFKSNENEVKEFHDDMLTVFKQKRELGLIPYLKHVNKNEVNEFSADVSFVNIIANYHIASTVLKSEVEKMTQFDMIISNFMGYGLYKHCIRSKDEVLNILQNVK